MKRRNMMLAVLGACVMPTVAQAGPKADGDKPAAGGQLPMPLATATVLRSHGRRGIMSVESTLVIDDGALLERAKLSMPRLNAAFNEAVRVEGTRLRAGALPDLAMLTTALQRAADTVLGRSGARVLLGTVMVT